MQLRKLLCPFWSVPLILCCSSHGLASESARDLTSPKKELRKIKSESDLSRVVVSSELQEMADHSRSSQEQEIDESASVSEVSEVDLEAILQEEEFKILLKEYLEKRKKSAIDAQKHVRKRGIERDRKRKKTTLPSSKPYQFNISPYSHVSTPFLNPVLTPVILFHENHKPGFRNLGNTCFANASTALLFESDIFQSAMEKNLKKGGTITLPGEDEAQLADRIQFQTSAKSLFDSREEKDASGKKFKNAWSLSSDLSKYFNALEKASESLDGTPNIGGIDGARLRRNQGDAFDFASKVMEYLEYPAPGWVKFVDFEDGSQKSIPHEGSGIISLNLKIVRDDLKHGLSFTTVLGENTRTETMAGENQLENEKGEKMDSIMRYGFQNLPSSVIFRLERFDWNFSGRVPEREKITLPVAMVEKLSLKSFKKEKKNYQLKGVVIHSGFHPSFGHYYSYIRDSESGDWIEYNDDHVHKVSLDTVQRNVSQNGYMFLYEEAPKDLDSEDIEIESHLEDVEIVSQESAKIIVTDSMLKVEKGQKNQDEDLN